MIAREAREKKWKKTNDRQNDRTKMIAAGAKTNENKMIALKWSLLRWKYTEMKWSQPN